MKIKSQINVRVQVKLLIKSVAVIWASLLISAPFAKAYSQFPI